MKRVGLLNVAVVVLIAGACGKRTAAPPVVVLTTPAVASTGLVDQLTAAFHREGPPVQTRVVTGDQIVASAVAGSGAAAVYRDQNLDDVLARRGLTHLRAVVADEDYYILGPEGDPAHVGSASDAAEAFRRIAARKRNFCSPVDVPLLLHVEHEIWSAARTKPSENGRYRPCHGDAIDVQLMAARLQAYTIVDRASADAKPQRHLRLLLKDVPLLHNRYVAVILRKKDLEERNRDTEWFVEWLMSARGREVVANLKSNALPKLYPPGER